MPSNLFQLMVALIGVLRYVKYLTCDFTTATPPWVSFYGWAGIWNQASGSLCIILSITPHWHSAALIHTLENVVCALHVLELPLSIQWEWDDWLICVRESSYSSVPIYLLSGYRNSIALIYILWFLFLYNNGDGSIQASMCTDWSVSYTHLTLPTKA